MNWNASLFFFVIVAFAIYIFAAGDVAKWKQVFTQPMGDGGTGGSGGPANPATPTGSSHQILTAPPANAPSAGQGYMDPNDFEFDDF